MSNPVATVEFSGQTPDIQLVADRSPRGVEIAAVSPARNVSVETSKGGNARVYVKTTQDWNEMIGFIPNKGDICVYSDHGTVSDGNGGYVYVPGIKVADGSAYLVDQPFVGDDEKAAILASLGEHEANTTVHVTQTEKDFWNNKLNCQVDQGRLILNRL